MSQATLVPNRINTRMADPKKVLSIYFTAGYPEKEDTTKVLQQLQDSGVDLVEIGLPFSDPLADGPTIQDSSTTALKNGMSTQLLFDQLKDIRKSIHIPLIVMGYFNPMLQYGVDAFLNDKISFSEISQLNNDVVKSAEIITKPVYEDYVFSDSSARQSALKLIQ